MILSVSRRTDIPACHSRWFYNRIQAGFVLVRNPYNPRQVTEICLKPENVDCIVFWTKNPCCSVTPGEPAFAERLSLLDDRGFKYYFQFTVTSYNQMIEPAVPRKKEIIAGFRNLSQKLGPHRLVWRYDPIIFTQEYTVCYHKKYFAYLAEVFAGFTDTCVISFVDAYPAIQSRMNRYGIYVPPEETLWETAAFMAECGRQNGITVTACCEKSEFRQTGVLPARCIDPDRIKLVTGRDFVLKPAKGQRSGCCCAESVDIGTYSTCTNGCIYCYADRRKNSVPVCDPESPLLGSRLMPEDKVYRK